jgi:hypothetical protein
MKVLCAIGIHRWKESFNYEEDVPRVRDGWGEQYTYVRKCQWCRKRMFWVQDLAGAWIDDVRCK